MKRTATLMCLLLVGCSTVERLQYIPSAQIVARPKSDLRYTMKTCSQLVIVRDEIYADLSARSKAHDDGTTGGSGSMAKIADLKGEHNAIISTMAAKNCVQ